MSSTELADRLAERLGRIEALLAGATTDGERQAADEARQRVQARLDATTAAEPAEPAEEMRFSLGNQYSVALFIALVKRMGLTPYRRRGTRYTTVLVKVSRRFLDETLWPEFVAVDRVLHQHLGELSQRVIADVVHHDPAEVAVVAEPPQLPLPSLG